MISCINPRSFHPSSSVSKVPLIIKLLVIESTSRGSVGGVNTCVTITPSTSIAYKTVLEVLDPL